MPCYKPKIYWNSSEMREEILEKQPVGLWFKLVSLTYGSHALPLI